MPRALQQYTVKKLREPLHKSAENDIEWVCNSLGFVTSRDHDKTAYKILQALVHTAAEGKGMTSEELTKEVQPTMGAVIYHLKRLIKAGLVAKTCSTYELRMNSLTRTIEEIEKELALTLDTVKKIATDVDTAVGLKHR